MLKFFLERVIKEELLDDRNSYVHNNRNTMVKKTDLKDSCARCDVINCINLFREYDDDKSVGGELYLCKQLSHSRVENEELSTYVCSNGRLLECACFITVTLNRLFPDDYLIIVSNETVGDMKASFYLAMSGHYRQAVLIQRCVFENFLYGLYFSTEYQKFSKNNEEKEEIQSKFLSWIDGGFRKSDTYLREIIQRGGVISKKENKLWGTLFDNLSQFVHTILKTPTGKTIKYENVEIKSCYSDVEFDKDSLIEWSRYYQMLFFLILYKLISLHPVVKKEGAGKLALKLLRAEFKDERRELNNQYLDIS